MTELSYAVHVAPSLPTTVTDLPPDLDRRVWSPISATLITGERDAVLADAVMTAGQAAELADWIVAAGKNLTTVYVTHGHGDHWFGLGMILERFPDAKAVAIPSVARKIASQIGSDFVETFWKRRFPGQIPENLVGVEELEGDRFELEGEELVAVDLGHTDTDDTTALHVPSIGLVVAGDAAYNDVHLYLAESDPQKRREWIAALDTIESLNPQTVIAGHQRAGRHDGPEIIEETRQYIRDFDQIAETTSTAQDLYDQVLALHPHRINPDALRLSAQGVKPSRASQ
jgi:glyoxylase-like metal-dependent hydrolase (beta-lactamase superfamily II)